MTYTYDRTQIQALILWFLFSLALNFLLSTVSCVTVGFIQFKVSESLISSLVAATWHLLKSSY